MAINIEIRGNKYDFTEIDEMLKDYLFIGENVYKLKKKVVDDLLYNFENKYRKIGFPFIRKEKYIKYFLHSAKELYKLAEFCFCNNSLGDYDKYVYQVNRNSKGTRVYLNINEEKSLCLIYNSIPFFLENWFIIRRILGDSNG